MCVCECQYTSELGGSGVLMSDSCDESLRSQNDFDRSTVYPKNLTNIEPVPLLLLAQYLLAVLSIGSAAAI